MLPDVWILEIERDMLTRLTFDDGVDEQPLWSPDGSWIYFDSDRLHGVAEIYRRKADGSGDAERLTTSDNAQHPRSISPDGKTVVFQGFPEGIRGDIMLLHKEILEEMGLSLGIKLDEDDLKQIQAARKKKELETEVDRP